MTEPQVFRDDDDEGLFQSLSQTTLIVRLVLWLLVAANVLLLIDWLALPEQELNGERFRQGLFMLLDGLGLAFLILQSKRSGLMEEDFRQSEQKFHRLFEHSGEAMLLCDPKDTRILRANSAAVYLFQSSLVELRQISLRQLCASPISSALSTAMNTGHAVAQNIRCRTAGQETIPVELSLAQIYDGRQPYLFVIIRDFREEQEKRRRQEQVIENLERTSEASLNIIEDLEIQRQELQEVNDRLRDYRDHLEAEVRARTLDLTASQEQLHRAQRMASIGALAAGIAHEINNPIGVMVLTAQNALDQLDTPDAKPLLERTCNKILTQAGRCSRIVKGVLQFARQQPTEKWENDVNSIIKATLHLMTDLVGSANAVITRQLDDRLPSVLANPIEMEQVFTNILQNSIQSARGNPIEITIRTRSTGDGVEVIVQDNGPGIDANSIEHVFDPFYTTRQQEGGTGLGLSIVHGIVTGHGGRIDIQSAEGQGTTVTVFFPAALNRTETDSMTAIT